MRSLPLQLVRHHGTSQPVQKECDVLVNAGQRCAQLVRNVGQKLVLEFKLLLAGDIQRAQQSLPFHRIADGTLQLFAGHVAFDQAVLNAVADGFERQRLIVLTRKDHHRHVRSLLHDPAKGFCAVAVGKVRIEQYQRGCFHV